MARDSLSERDRIRGRRYAGAAHSWIDINQDFHDDMPRQSAVQGGEEAGMVSDNSEFETFARQRCNPRDRLITGYGRGQENGGRRARKLLNLMQSCTTDTDRTGLGLQRCNRAALMRLCMRAQVQPALAGERSHPLDITFKCRLVEHEAWGWR